MGLAGGISSESIDIRGEQRNGGFKTITVTHATDFPNLILEVRSNQSKLSPVRDPKHWVELVGVSILRFFFLRKQQLSL